MNSKHSFSTHIMIQEYGKKISNRNLDNKQEKLDLLIHKYKFDLINLINIWQEDFQNCNIERYQYYQSVQEEEK